MATYPSGQGAGLQNLYSPVRIRSSPPLLRGLLTGSALLSWAACSDPPDPAPSPPPSAVPQWSTARHVRWAGPDDPVSRPLAIFADMPGGPMDALAADDDVTTFLNDRFHPWFLDPDAASDLPRAPTAWFVDPRGCLVDGPWTPATPTEWIAHANAVLLRLADPADSRSRTQPIGQPVFPLPESHPLRGRCSG